MPPGPYRRPFSRAHPRTSRGGFLSALEYRSADGVRPLGPACRAGPTSESPTAPVSMKPLRLHGADFAPCKHNGLQRRPETGYFGGTTLIHTFTVLSLLPVATNRPSGENATEVTPSACPWKLANSLPVWTSNKYTFLSIPTVTTTWPSGEKARAVIVPVCAWLETTS